MSAIGSFKGLGEGRTSGTIGAACNILCTVVGTGLLNLPYAGAKSGWIGVPMLVILGVMACYTADILIKSLNMINNNKCLLELQDEKRECETYGDIGEAAFGAFGRWMVNVQMHLTLVMVACIYNLLGGLNFTQLFPGFALNPAVVTVAAIVWFHVFLKTLGEVSWVSIFNAVITLALEIVVISVALGHPPSYEAETTIVNTNVLDLGSAFAGFAFAFGVHPILPSVYRTMKKPEQYRPMIIWSFTIVIAVYLPMYFVGYSVYGDNVQSPIYATDGLAGLAIVNVMIGLITAHVLMAYAIVINVPETALETAADVEQKRAPVLWRILLRSCFVGLTVVVSVALQTKFPPFLDLVSAFTSTFTQYVFPSLFYLKLAKRAGIRLPMWEWVFNVLILLCAITGSVFGVIDAVKELAGL